MTRLGRKPRHGSGESSSSWRSQDTVRALFRGNSSRHSIIKTDPNGRAENVDDGSVSPGAMNPQPDYFSQTSPEVSPRDLRTQEDFGNYQQALDELSAAANEHSIQSQDQPGNRNQAGPNRVRSSVDLSAAAASSEGVGRRVSQHGKGGMSLPSSPSIHPGSKPPTLREAPELNDDRRPSVASANTVSSTSSKGSAGRLHRKLHGIFGDDHSGRDSRHASNTSLATASKENSNQTQRGRDSFLGQPAMSRSESPFGSRPRTPLPTSDVVPWVFQDFQDIPHYGDAPVREAPSSTDLHRYVGENSQAEPNNAPPSREPTHHSHKFHLHRHHKSKDDSKPPARDPRTADLLRSATGRDGSTLSLKGHPAFNSHASDASGATSPTPSSYSATNRDPMNNFRFQSSAGKRSLLDKFKRGNRHKEDKAAGTDQLQSLPSSTRSLQEQNKAPKPSRLESSTGSLKSRGPSFAGSDITLKPGSQDSGQPPSAPASRKESTVKVPGHGRLKGAVRRGLSTDVQAGKDLANRKGSQAPDSWFNLDTDLSRMEGIVTQPPPLHPSDGEVFAGGPTTDEHRAEIQEVNASRGSGAWDAPDSWAVKRIGDENLSRLQEIDEAGIPQKEGDDGHQYCIRIFRADSTFATLSTGLNSTVTEILHTLGRKSFLQDELGNYQIILRKHDLQRQLEAGERPVAIQKRLLEQTGYTSRDHIDEIGREDNSYLCRFTFVPAKLSGFSSLERDPGFGKMQKFSHIDLQGRNLITIPITLYRKATEIISLNLSRNLSLDVPKDFIQSCLNLRELKYVSNEAWHLPPSLSLASRLTVLDISNNKLEQLEHADLSKLSSLVSIKLANNKLKHLPEYFGGFTQLRSLNLSSNYLEKFPDFLCKLKSLVDLDISFNAITKLPGIGQLTTLERLWATNNRLTGAFPDDFKDLSSLKELDVRYNALSNIDVVAQLPQLEQFMAGHNSVPGFSGTFEKIRVFYLNHNPVTRFTVTSQIPTMTTLSLASAKLSELQDDFAEQLPNLTKVILDNNHLVSLGPQIGKLRKLEHLSMAKNQMNNLPIEIGLLQELRFLDLRENNLKKLPSEIWCALRLDTLNVCSNVLADFPKPPSTNALAQLEAGVNNSLASSTGGVSSLSSSPSFEELGKLEDFQARRPSHASSTLLSVGSSPATSYRKGSIASMYGPGGRKASTASRTPTDGMITPVARKDSSFSARVATTFAGSLRHLFLADNRLTDDVFDEITLLPELRILNLSYNELYDIPQRSLRRWPHLAELYVSGNELSSLPSDDFEEGSSLKVLHINANKFQVLPAELGKINKLTILDAGSNSLKYNVSNWPYDWNWNWNHNLRYLNLSGNKRLEIKPNVSYSYGSSGSDREGRDLTNFNSLTSLRVLGLMDVTLTIPSVPEQTEDRRVRTSGSLAGTMTYGMADSLGRNEHLSTIDMIVPKFRGHETETLLGMFDGQALSSGGSKVAKFLQENFSFQFGEELKRLADQRETPVDALRRTFLALNKDLATVASQSMDEKELRGSQLGHRGSIVAPILSSDDLASGSVATVLFLQGMELYVANVGDTQAMLVHSEGGYRILTRRHDPAEPSERQRIREAGGYVSRQGRLNDVLDVSRAFGYTQLLPAVMAAPHISQITLKEQDEMVLIASKELWQYLTPDVAVDIARQERGDLMRAAQKLRDLALAFGATGKIMVIMIGVGDLKKRERARNRAQSMSMGPMGMPDEQVFSSKRGKRPRDAVNDSTLARLDQEVEAPTGDVSLVFTDIKNSTLLWETYPIAMRSAIKIHNSIMRRQLRIIGGYEVKTEGDAFMVCFPTATSALLWCFSVQSLLLEAPWPSEILNSVHGQEVQDADGNVIFRGLSVRMGIHWGCPVCEPDPITNRMDYFGPMVNRASRISAVADGGQITVSSDFITEIQRTLEAYSESDRAGSTGSEESMYDDAIGQAIRRELRSLSSQGFEVKELGERKLKGLENPEYVYLMFPHSLAGRLIVQQQQADAEAAQSATNPGSKAKDSQLTIDTNMVWDLWSISLRLEMLCSTLECPGSTQLKAPETAILERMKSRGGEVTDRFLINFVEHQVSRIETCTSTLAMRHLVRPFRAKNNILNDACPMDCIFQDLTKELSELRALKARVEASAKS